MDWIKSLKPGDTVFLCHRWVSRQNHETTVEKVGRKWITFTNSLRYDTESGAVKEHSYELWQSKEQHERFIERKRRWRKVASFADDLRTNAKPEVLSTHDEALSQIEQLLGMTPKKS